MVPVDKGRYVLSSGSTTNSMPMVMPSWLSSDKSPQRAGLLRGNLRCEGSKVGEGWCQKEIKILCEILVGRATGCLPCLCRSPAFVTVAFQCAVPSPPYAESIGGLCARPYVHSPDIPTQFQKGMCFDSATRRATDDSKAACGWTSAQEAQWKNALEQSRHYEAIWIVSTGLKMLTYKAEMVKFQRKLQSSPRHVFCTRTRRLRKVVMCRSSYSTHAFQFLQP